MSDPMMIAGLAMICAGALLAALILDLAPSHRGTQGHDTPERNRPMRIRRRAATHSTALDHLDFSAVELAQLHAYIQRMTVFPRPEDTPRVA
ncbi:hypothetical protein [Williamsia maris]|nr:hypothetical protein [Williamsia maris]